MKYKIIEILEWIGVYLILATVAMLGCSLAMWVLVSIFD